PFAETAVRYLVRLSRIYDARCCLPDRRANSRRAPMSFATTRDDVRLHYEEVGSGTPIVFVHEFAGDWRAWEPQMRYFARRYRCVTFSFRGYHPSDVPPETSSYGYEKFRDDVIAILDHLRIDKAHI